MKRSANLPLQFARRRNKILRELEQLKIDTGHWNGTHPDEQPIIIDFDLSKDIERMRAEKDGTK